MNIVVNELAKDDFVKALIYLVAIDKKSTLDITTINLS
jgi:hypothetical protein